MGCDQAKAAQKYPTTEAEKAQMTQPFCHAKGPLQSKLQVGKDYYYCSCGLSKNQPFCDGSHKGTKFTPIKFTAQKENNYICQCRRSKNAPFCDGTHSTLDF